MLILFDAHRPSPADMSSQISKLRKRRGVVRASITRLATRLRELEAAADPPDKTKNARQLLGKLKSLDEEFRGLHYEVIDLFEDGGEDSVEAEQVILDKHDDDVSTLTVRLESLCVTTATSTTDVRKSLSRRLSRLQAGLRRIRDLAEDPIVEHSTLMQCQEEVIDFKKDNAALYDSLLAHGIDERDDLSVAQSALEVEFSHVASKLKRLLATSSSDTTTSSSPLDTSGVRLPKLDVPTFDGDIIHWKQFWDQFTVSVHDRTNLSNAEKIVYLQHALKDGSAKNAIEGLSHSGDNYSEAVKCLKTRYDRPRLIHRTHVQKIVDTPAIRDGNGRELRRIHDNIQQHVRALKTLGCELPGKFITSMIELKLDTDTLFEWQKHSQSSTDVPHYKELLDFIDLRAQASETSCSTHRRKPAGKITSFAASATSSNCVVCKTEKHPLYVCAKFKALNHDEKNSVLKTNNLCVNCLTGGHYKRQCKSTHKCKICHKPHHTLLHIEPQTNYTSEGSMAPKDTTHVSSNTAMKLKSNALLMTCRVSVITPDGSSVEARALLDNASSASFVSERLVQSLSLPRFNQHVRVSGIGGISQRAPIQSISSFEISAVGPNKRKMGISAVIVPKVTCDLPLAPVPFKSNWKHISDLPLADPGFGQPGRIDLLLGVDVFIDVLRHGRRSGPPNSPSALETEFGWVLCGGSGISSDPAANTCVTSLHSFVTSGDDILRRFWEIEEAPPDQSALSIEERTVVRHFETNYARSSEGRFVVPLPRNHSAKSIGESRSQAVRRFLSLERSLATKGRFKEFDDVIQEYFELGHAEQVPITDLEKPVEDTFYLPMHAVYKTSSTTTKVRAVFDASAKSSTGVSLNDTLLVGPTIHPPLLDVLLLFRSYPIALTADISKMYRAIELTKNDRDLHRFVWRSSPSVPLKDYRMTRVTFGVSASSFAANMAVKQNAIDYSQELPQAADVVQKGFYVDDCLTGADDTDSTLILQRQLTDLLARGGFTLRKWNSSDLSVLEQIPKQLRDTKSTQTISEINEYTKTLGVEWNTSTDEFGLAIPEFSPDVTVTKRRIVSDVAKIFDVMGWFSPAVAKMKILLQRLWEIKLDWDDPIPESVHQVWTRWRDELPLLATVHIPRCYSPLKHTIVSTQLHGFSDASEEAYAGVVYLRIEYSDERVHTSLIISKTKVSPIKRLSIPRLELCGAQVLTRLLHRVKKVLKIPVNAIFAWTDSTVVLGWLAGSPRRFKTFVGNRVSYIIDQLPPERWRHVPGPQNPADCASRGLFPAELTEYDLWWGGPSWLKMSSVMWPEQPHLPSEIVLEEERNVCHLATSAVLQSIIPIDRYYKFITLKRVTAWMFRFIKNARPSLASENSPCLTVQELTDAENYWVSIAQRESFPEELDQIKANVPLHKSSYLLPLRPFLDPEHSILRVGGRMRHSTLSYSRMHPIILHSSHPLTRLIIQAEHVRLLHDGPTLLMSSLSRRYHIIGVRKSVRSVTRQCIICKRHAVKPANQLLGQLPLERVTPSSVFTRVGVDYAGPFQIKYGHVRKPTVLKAYICLFVCLAVKAVHLELVSDLTTECFVAALRRFVARRGCPSLIWSDHGTNFVGANRELKELNVFLNHQVTHGAISEFCCGHNITWKYIPERSPHFGGLWESAVKNHLKRIVSPVKLSFEEFTTVLTQVEACLNSRPLVPTNSADDDGIEVLTPGHFLIGKPVSALPDPQLSYKSISILRRWHLCQCLIRHFWQRWQNEYLSTLNRYNKWKYPTRNVSAGDIVVVQESGTAPTKWPLGRVLETHPGKDGLVRVVTLKTSQGTYTRPVSKIAVLLPID